MSSMACKSQSQKNQAIIEKKSIVNNNQLSLHLSKENKTFKSTWLPISQNAQLFLIKPRFACFYQKEHFLFERIMFGSISKMLDAQQNFPHSSTETKIKSFISAMKQKPKGEPDLELFQKAFDSNQKFSLYKEKILEQPNIAMLFKQLYDLIRLQFDQQISNSIVFDYWKQGQFCFNSMFVAAILLKNFQIFQQKNFKQSQKLLFFDFSFIEEINDNTLYQDFCNQNDCIYIKLVPCENSLIQQGLDKNVKSIIPIYFQKPKNKITWQQFKLIYKTQIKKIFKNFNSNLCILSISCQMDKSDQSIQFDNDCLRKILNKLKVIGKDRLYIHTILIGNLEDNLNETIPQEELKKIEAEEERKQQTLSEFINVVEQGFLGNFADNYVKFNDITDQNQDFQQWQIENLELQSKIDNDKTKIQQLNRHLRMQMIKNNNSPIIQKAHQIQFPEFVLLSNPLKIVQLKYQNQPINFLENSIFQVNYDENICSVLQRQTINGNSMYYIFWAYLNNDNDRNELECEQLCLSEAIAIPFCDKDINEKSASMLIKQQKIYLQFTNDILIQVDYKEKKITQVQRKIIDSLRKIKKTKVEQVPEIIKTRKGSSLVSNPIFDGFNFMSIGGECQNSLKQCKYLEVIKINSDEEFESVVVSKENFYEGVKGFNSWPNSIVLENKNEQPFKYIILPGNFENRENKYNQVINRDHQKVATQFTFTKDNQSYQFKPLAINYISIQYTFNDSQNLENLENLENFEVCKKLKPIPLFFLSNHQQNIQYNIKEGVWKLSYSLASSINMQDYLKGDFERYSLELSILIVKLKVRNDFLDVKQYLIIRKKINKQQIDAEILISQNQSITESTSMEQEQ